MALLSPIVISKETVRNRGGLVRQLSLDRFENERRGRSDMMNYSYTPQFIRKKSTQDLVKKVMIFSAYLPIFVHLRRCVAGHFNIVETSQKLAASSQ